MSFHLVGLSAHASRDRDSLGSAMWLAGGGVKAGAAYGATSEYGSFAVEHKVHAHGLHCDLIPGIMT